MRYPNRPLTERVSRWWSLRREDVFWKPVAIVGAVLLLILMLLLEGCSTFSEDLQAHEEKHCKGWQHTGSAPFYKWHKTRPESLKPWVYVRAPDTDFACRIAGAQAQEGHRINACATWKPAGCVIILPED